MWQAACDREKCKDDPADSGKTFMVFDPAISGILTDLRIANSALFVAFCGDERQRASAVSDVHVMPVNARANRGQNLVRDRARGLCGFFSVTVSPMNSTSAPRPRMFSGTLVTSRTDQIHGNSAGIRDIISGNCGPTPRRDAAHQSIGIPSRDSRHNGGARAVNVAP